MGIVERMRATFARRGLKRHQPDDVDTEAMQLVEAPHKTAKIECMKVATDRQ